MQTASAPKNNPYMQHFNTTSLRLPAAIMGLLAVGTVSTQLTAAPRTAQEAASVAQEFLAARSGRRAAQVRLTPALAATRADEGATAPYYVFNDSEGGFVVVSGSDLMRPVVAYSAEATFTTADMPANLSQWLEQLAAAAAYVEQHPEAAISTADLNSLADYAPIQPLLGKIAWDQNFPYSNLCPRTYPTGCMATALAQVMRYHRYPEHGTGSNSYTTASQTVSVNFAEQTYNWDLMTEEYNDASTDEQRAEVAKLMFHCGVALNMSYAADNSGSTAPCYLAATVDYFGYNPLTTLQCRNVYPYDEWNNMIYTELQEGRPVLYSGIASSGGHAFVVDGYSSNGFYHVNWGWSGQYNGYYDICVLNPTGVGAGAAVSTNGYSTEQSAVLQLTPTANTGRYYSPVACEGGISSTTKKTTPGGTMRLVLKNLTNYSPWAIDGEVFALISGNGTSLRCPVGSLSIAASGVNILTNNISANITLPTDLTDGTYRLYPYYQASGSDSTALIRCRLNGEGYLNLEVSNGSVAVSKPTVDMSMTAANWSFATERYVVNTESTVSVDVTNGKDETFVGSFYLDMTDPNDMVRSVKSDTLYKIAPGETQHVTFTYNFATEGTWTTDLSASLQNITDNPKFTLKGAGTEFEVVSTSSALTAVAADEASTPVEVYNLMGQRVATLAAGIEPAAQLPAGIYIVRGKKIVIR